MFYARSHLLSILLLLTVAATSFSDVGATGTANSLFLEAPVFYNSPTCRQIPAEENQRCSKDVINIAMTLDESYLRGSMAAILSIIKHSSCPQNLFFHFISSQNPKPSNLESAISTSFPYLNFEVYPFQEEMVATKISDSVREALNRPLNYARAYLADLLPECVDRVIYLDSDVILADDIAELWSANFSGESVILAPEHCNANMSRYFTPAFWSNPVLSLTFSGRSKKACYFNTGVMVIDLKKWREKDYTREIEDWMDLQKRMRIYELGSLPPFLLVFAGQITPVEARWNQHGLGGDNYEGHCRNLHPGPVSLLHWSGRGKPWVRLDANRPCAVDALWAPYDMLKKGDHPLD